MKKKNIAGWIALLLFVTVLVVARAVTKSHAASSDGERKIFLNEREADIEILNDTGEQANLAVQPDTVDDSDTADNSDTTDNSNTAVPGLTEQLSSLSVSVLDLSSVPQELLSAAMERAKEKAGEEAGQQEEEEDNEYDNLAIATVNNYVNVRSTPDTDGEIVGKMYDRSVAQIENSVEQEDGTWLQVVSGNVEGYIKAEFFLYGDDAQAVIDDYVIRYVVVNATRLNVRAEADISAKKIGYIDKGERVPLVEEEEGWFKIKYTDRKEGYVSADYATVVEEFIYAKSIEEERKEQEAKALLAKREEEARQNAAAVPEEQLTVETPLVTYSSNSELRSQLVNNAMQYLGNRYIHGGSSLAGGTDCSGFTSLLYANYGYSISRTPEGQLSSAGRGISYEQIQPGDIICYTSNGKRCTHVAIYIGNGQIIHSANSRKGVIISDAHYSQIMGIKNVID